MRCVFFGLIFLVFFQVYAQPVYYLSTKNFPVGSINGKLATEVGFHPVSVAANNSHVFVSTGMAEILKVDLTTGLIESFPGPTGSMLAIDQAGNLYAAHGNRIEKRNSSTGVWSIVAGGDSAGFSGDGGNANAATLNQPTALQVDAAGNIYFIDSGNARIRRVDGVTNVITTVAGTGVNGYNGDGIAATTAQLKYPKDIALDASGNVYIADTENNRIRKVNASTGVISTIAGDGFVGDSGNGGLAVNARVFETGAIVVDSNGDIFFAQHVDMKLNSRIRKIRSSDGIIELVGGNDDRYPNLAPSLAANSPFSYTLTMDVNAAGKIFICASEVALVRGLDTTTGLVSTVAGNFSNYFCCDGGPADDARFNMFDSRVGPDGEMVFIERFRIRKISANGTISTLAGTGHPSTVGGEGNNVLASSVNFGNMSDLAFDHSGNLYFSETDTPPAQFSRLRKIDALTGTVQTIAGNGAISYGGDGGPALSAGLFCDKLAVDPNNNPHFIDAGSNGNMRIRKVDTTTGTITTVAGGGTGGDGGLALDANLGICRDIAFDAAGNLFIAQDYRIRKVDVATGILSTIAGDGTSGFSGDGGPANAAKLGRIRSIDFDSYGNLFIADWQNLRVRVIDTSGQINTVAGSDGGGSFTLADGEVLAAESVVSSAYLTVNQDTVYVPGGSYIQKIYKDKSPQTITFSSLPPTSVGSRIVLKATSTSGLPVYYESSDAAIATISDDWINIVGAGTVTITARQAGNGDFRPAPPKSQTLSAAKGTQLIYFPTLPPKFAGDPNFNLSAKSTSTLAVTYSSSNLSVASVSGTTITIVGPGTATITASQTGNANYNAAPDVTQSLVVHPSPQDVNFLTVSPKKFGDARFELFASSPSGLPVSFASSNPGVIAVQGSIASIVGAGSVTLSASHLGDETHPPAMSTQTITVAKADQVISLFLDGTSPRTVGEDMFDPNAWASSGLPVEYSSSNPSIATVENGYILPKSVGNALITVTQGGSENFNAATAQSFTLQVTPESEFTFTYQFGNDEQDLRFSYPRGMTTDNDGNTYVACSQEGTIKKFSKDGTLIKVIGARGAQNGNFTLPYDVDLLNNEIYVLDRGNNRVQVLSATGEFVRRFGYRGSGAGQLLNPVGLAVGSQQLVFVADAGNNRIVVFTSEGKFLYSFGEAGAGLGRFNGIRSVAVDASQNIYVVDSGGSFLSRVQVFSTSGVFLRKLELPGGDFVRLIRWIELNANNNLVLLTDRVDGRAVEILDQVGAEVSRILLPNSVAGVSSLFPSCVQMHDDRILVSDSFNGVIDAYDLDGLHVETYGEITGRQLRQPLGISTDGLGNFYVSGDGEPDLGYVKVLDPSGNFVRKIGFGGNEPSRLSTPSGVAIGSDGRVYVSDIDGEVKIYENNGDFVTSFGQQGSGDGEFDQPRALALDGDDNIYVADYHNSRIQVFDKMGNFAYKFGTFGSGNGEFDGPHGVFVDEQSRIYVTDTQSTQVFDQSGNFLQKISGGGFSVKVGADGQIYVCSFEHRINVYTSAGVYKFSVGSYGTKGGGEMYGPKDFIVDDQSKKLFVVDFISTVHVFGIPKVEVRQTNLISSGDTFDFGSKTLGAELLKVFTVKNTGSGQLKLGEAPVPFGVAAEDFVVTGWNAGLILAPGAETNFNVSFKPTAAGVRIADLKVPTNVVSAGEFFFQLSGTATKNSQEITFNPLINKTFNDAPFALSATSSSDLPVTYTSSDETIASIENDIVTLNKPGIVTITASQPGNEFYQEASSVTQQLTVDKASQQISFGTLGVKKYTDVPFELSASSSAGLPVSYASSNPSVATVSGNQVTIQGAGTVTVTASQSGDTNYNAAIDVEQVLSVSKAEQSISFEPILDKTLGDLSISLSAQASSSLNVQFTSNDKVLIDGTVATLLKAGRATIKASQHGNDNYEAAAEVEQTFCINPSKPTITTDNSNPGQPVLVSSATENNQWYFNDVPIDGATQIMLTPSMSGTYTVRSTVDDCVSQISEGVVLLVTGDIDSIPSTELLVFPNPVENTLSFLLKGDGTQDVHYAIVDVMGRTLRSGVGQMNAQVPIDLSVATSGVYILRVETSAVVLKKTVFKK